MLYSIYKECYIEDVPYKDQFDKWRVKLGKENERIIKNYLKELIQVSEIQTSSWIPGSDWSDTVFEPIYTEACEYDSTASAKFFGQLVWQAVLEDDRVWSFGRYEKDGVPIEGLTYFVLSNPPEGGKKQMSKPSLEALVDKYKKVHR
jgi:hypothetical protein